MVVHLSGPIQQITVSAFADDAYTQSKKDGFDDDDILEWYLVTPSGLLYGLTVEMVGGIDNVFNGGGSSCC